MNWNRTLISLLLIFCTAPLAAQRRSASTGPETLIRNGTVLTITGGVIENGSVLIRGGKIAAVGPADRVSAGPGATVLDATGKYVMPGIIDAHSHTAVDGAVNEFSLSNTGMVRIADVITNQDVDSYRQLAGGTTAANILHGSANAIGGQNAVVKWKWGRPIEEWLIADAPEGIKFALGENPKRSNFPPPSGQPRRYPNTRMGVEDVIRSAFTGARDYRAEWNEYEAARKRGQNPIPPRRDLLMETMLDILDGRILVHSHCYRADEIVMLMRVAEEFGWRVRTFQHVLEGYKVANEMAAHGAGGSTFIDWWGFKFEAFDATPFNVALMQERGVLASINSDSSELARHLNLDAAKAMKYGGMNEEDALALCTINPARQLGIDHRVGSIEVGKDGDLVIWSGHPFSTYSRVETTLIEGEIYFDRQQDLQRREELRLEKERLLAMEKEREDKKKEREDKKKEEKPDEEESRKFAGVTR
ncbi:MAG TPA: amidohydrolase family protein [Thermoanaerobaculia bacterium]|nr:amidohydrolase family protein [Thermoanaerobaculia bacterium]